MKERPFIIAGGGIGGLATALGLARVRKHSLVLEQADRFGEIGAGIQIGPNAFNCFDYLGIGEALRNKAVYIDRLRLMDALSGEEICHIPLDVSFRNRFGNPYAVVHRADLHGALAEACKSSGFVEMLTCHAVSGYHQQGESVRVSIQNREELEGCVLIGADGLHSAVRKQMHGDEPPRVSGHTTYRSVIPTESMPEDLRWNAATLWAGPKCHIVHYPLKGWKVFNLVVTFHNDVREAVAGKPVSREEVERGFEHIHPRPKQVIEHGKDWKLWVLCDRDPVQHWVDGRVALLGDAAHPMLQYFAQGACMALEDAVSFSHRCGTEGDLDKALALYLEDRMVRTSRVVIDSRLIGDHIYHPSGAAAALRNSVMRSLSTEQWYEKLGWLYDGGRPKS
ncbi:MAG: 3-hydroxybenzoate 6-monooxygenase [SAR324 cluster bacterium]|nr:salicylate hydroxylase [Deltaproteobacteria bacterium]MDP6093959.1 3-hydroxybenzoate 6-monooxygenase [SAR324 cluster bacterium]MDP6245046.1 3-hydroxybenzoate 6-monooxygenase [SAR324 cluster bacterium]MDP6330956.1 3-hydroxybenzoate 6-monooxygenase [SAR324 cluster bacterium]MDP6465154.1 3-hydroxybenzoate 6-monooxygenase [SAR324 cluster bacterium]